MRRVAMKCPSISARQREAGACGSASPRTSTWVDPPIQAPGLPRARRHSRMAGCRSRRPGCRRAAAARTRAIGVAGPLASATVPAGTSAPPSSSTRATRTAGRRLPWRRARRRRPAARSSSRDPPRRRLVPAGWWSSRGRRRERAKSRTTDRRHDVRHARDEVVSQAGLGGEAGELAVRRAPGRRAAQHGERRVVRVHARRHREVQLRAHRKPRLRGELEREPPDGARDRGPRRAAGAASRGGEPSPRCRCCRARSRPPRWARRLRRR